MDFPGYVDRNPKRTNGEHVTRCRKTLPRRVKSVYLLSFTFLALMVSASEVGQALDSSHGFECPGAVAWEERHREYSNEAMKKRDATRALKKPELLAELQRRVSVDQDARREWISQRYDARAHGRVTNIDKDNLSWLRRLIKAQGYPTAEQVGETGVHLAWVLLQHSDQDPQFRASLIPILVERYKTEEMSPLDVAKSIDRSLKMSGHPQRFGTQFDWFGDHFDLPPDTMVINRNRAEIGLMSIEDYACLVNRQLRQDKSFDVQRALQ